MEQKSLLKSLAWLSSFPEIVENAVLFASAKFRKNVDRIESAQRQHLYSLL